jgi:hypothetical protein
MEVQRLLRGLTPKERGAGGALMVLAGIMSREEEAALALLDRDSFDSLLIEHYGGAVKWLRKAKRAHATTRRQIWDGNMHVLRERMERAVERCHGPAVVSWTSRPPKTSPHRLSSSSTSPTTQTRECLRGPASC